MLALFRSAMAILVAVAAAGCAYFGGRQGGDLIVDPLRLSISNGTTLAVSLRVNGEIVLEVAPKSHLDPIEGSLLPAAPWHVETLTPLGRVLSTLDVAPGDVWHTVTGPNGGSGSHGRAIRAELSCGRLDVWSGPPMLGPAPPANFPPGDCEP